ncbi:hypothetical protein BDN70DRAFT_882303 [Pholiota conissans]|uniref:Uncharacterized protein n=1 Tax=Pholiota conissans TaxID=109636 RepID=A0A9P6CR05_9AGAR|nr:hypothetical protein BDN70DRAFT_882303 [Pholiota conissans]
MDIPSTRELELEILLREKDAQLAEMTDEISALRQYLSKDPGPSTADAVTLPPALLSVLLPHINSSAQNATSNTTSTVNAALTQRARVLQEENDELYELLKHSETGKLKDEVRGMRRVVAKLEGALKDSHKVILSLSTELDKAYETILMSSRQPGNSVKSKSHSYSPHNSYYSVTITDAAANGNASNRPLPTEPRAHKRPRLSEPQISSPVQSTPVRLAPSLPLKPQAYHHNSNGPPPRSDHPRDQRRHSNDNGRNLKPAIKMEVDGDDRGSSPHNRDRDRIRERERNDTSKARERDRAKERERPREFSFGKDWDRDGNKNTHSRRNGSSHRGGGGGGSGVSSRQPKGNDRNSNATNQTSDNANRTLQERLGL